MVGVSRIHIGEVIFCCEPLPTRSLSFPCLALLYNTTFLHHIDWLTAMPLIDYTNQWTPGIVDHDKLKDSWSINRHLASHQQDGQI